MTEKESTQDDHNTKYAKWGTLIEEMGPTSSKDFMDEYEKHHSHHNRRKSQAQINSQLLNLVRARKLVLLCTKCVHLFDCILRVQYQPYYYCFEYDFLKCITNSI